MPFVCFALGTARIAPDEDSHWTCVLLVLADAFCRKGESKIMALYSAMKELERFCHHAVERTPFLYAYTSGDAYVQMRITYLAEGLVHEYGLNVLRSWFSPTPRQLALLEEHLDNYASDDEDSVVSSSTHEQEEDSQLESDNESVSAEERFAMEMTTGVELIKILRREYFKNE